MPSCPATTPPNRREAPWLAGMRAARANLVPGLIVQALMLAILIAYYWHPPVRDWLNGLAEVKQRWSYGYSALASICAGAFVPELLRIFVFLLHRYQPGQHVAASLSLFASVALLFWYVLRFLMSFGRD
jgi:hypothetical protein